MKRKLLFVPLLAMRLLTTLRLLSAMDRLVHSLG